MYIKEIICKTALSPSRLPGLEYSLNPYRGCSHQCIYCYVPAILRISYTEWHSTLAVKKNIPLVLAQELKRKKPGVIGISTVTDPYQPIEEKYHLTQYCLKQALQYDFPISIQTKSNLILRDLPIITQFTKAEVMVSIATNNDTHRKLLEPGSSTLTNRLEVLKQCADIGINTSVFFGPIYPTLTETEIIDIVKLFADNNVREIMVDQFHLKPGIRERINQKISNNPDLLKKFKDRFYVDTTYYPKIIKYIQQECFKHHISFKQAFP
ncbi:MAG: radical SAM protein [Candidatus Thermoplasmatota archaeon]|nr:radical SAM protein [Candidatus Thermoplasmatota archaeon]MBU1940821.1 radical SAM protein [Candidatus Thermoplasmatota archaeon]